MLSSGSPSSSAALAASLEYADLVLMTVKLHEPSPPPAATTRSICSTGNPRFDLTSGPVCLSWWNSRLPIGRLRISWTWTSTAHWASFGRRLVASRGDPGPVATATGVPAPGSPAGPAPSEFAPPLTPPSPPPLLLVPLVFPLLTEEGVEGLDGSSSPNKPPR